MLTLTLTSQQGACAPADPNTRPGGSVEFFFRAKPRRCFPLRRRLGERCAVSMRGGGSVYLEARHELGIQHEAPGVGLGAACETWRRERAFGSDGFRDEACPVVRMGTRHTRQGELLRMRVCVRERACVREGVKQPGTTVQHHESLSVFLGERAWTCA